MAKIGEVYEFIQPATFTGLHLKLLRRKEKGPWICEVVKAAGNFVVGELPGCWEFDAPRAWKLVSRGPIDTEEALSELIESQL